MCAFSPLQVSLYSAKKLSLACSFPYLWLRIVQNPRQKFSNRAEKFSSKKMNSGLGWNFRVVFHVSTLNEQFFFSLGLYRQNSRLSRLDC